MNTRFAASLQENVRDVIIIGAGPAGLTAAAHLAARGRDVLLLDRSAFPREKVCGGGLVADSIGCLQRLGLDERVRQQARVVDALNVRSRSGHEVCLNSGFWIIKRSILDTLLWRHAQDAGAAFRTLPVDTVWYDADGRFCCAGREKNGEAIGVNTRYGFKARYGVIATGTAAIRNDYIGIMPAGADNAMALRCYVRSEYTLDRLEGAFEPCLAPGYAWIFPLQEHEYNVGCIHFFPPGQRTRPNLRQLFETFRETHPAAKALFARARAISPLRAHPLRCGRLVDTLTDNIATLLAGETIGTTYPFTGEGIGKAMETGETAAQVLDQALQQGGSAPLRNYPRLLARRFGQTYAGYARAQRWLFRKGVNDLATLGAARSPRLRQQISRMIRDELTPDAVLTPKNILTSLFS